MPKSPKIAGLAWGRIEVEHGDGTTRSFRDAKLHPGGSRAWDWTETGTSHSPGVQPADVEELLEAGVDVVVLGCGVHERLQVMEETRRVLREAGVELHVLATPAATERYGAIRAQGRAVGGLFHTTC